MYDSEKKEIINFTQKRIFKVRDKTLELISNLEPEDLVIQTEDYVSPIKWHLGHTPSLLPSSSLWRRNKMRKMKAIGLGSKKIHLRKTLES